MSRKAGGTTSAAPKGRASQVKGAHKKADATPIAHHVLEQPLIRPRVPVTKTMLRGGVMTPENRVLHAIETLTAKSETVSHKDVRERCFAAAEIADAGTIWRGKERDALRALLITIPHPDCKVSLSAGQAVAAVAPRGDKEVFRETRALLTNDTDHVRLSALIALAGSAAHEDVDAVESTACMLQDRCLKVRRRAVMALSTLAPAGHPLLLRSICLYIHHQQPHVRAAACRALGRVSQASDETALSLLRETLISDSDISVSIQALAAIVPLTITLRNKSAEQKVESSMDTARNNKGQEGGKKDNDSADIKSSAKMSLARNVSAVMSAMQDPLRSTDKMFVKRMSNSLRHMMGSGSEDDGAGMVQESHREGEGYICSDPPTHGALRLGLKLPDVIPQRGLHDRSLLSPIMPTPIRGGKFEEDAWGLEDDDDSASAFVILDGEILPRSQLSPRSLARATPASAPILVSPLKTPLGSATKASPGLTANESPFRRNQKVNTAQQWAEDIMAGVSEFDVLERSAAPMPPDPYEPKYGTGAEASGGFFSEIPADVRQALGPIRLNVNGRNEPVDVLLFWRRSRIWTLDITDCVVHPTTGSSAAIWNLEQSSYLSCSNVSTSQIVPHLNDVSFRFAAGPLRRSGRQVSIFVYMDYALEVPMQYDTASGSMLFDCSQPACKFTLAQALGDDFANALKPPHLLEADSTMELRDSASSRPTSGGKVEISSMGSAKPQLSSIGLAKTSSDEGKEEEEGLARVASDANAKSQNLSRRWGAYGYCGTGEVPYKKGRIWYLFLSTHVSVFECCGESELEKSRLLHGPRPVDQVCCTLTIHKNKSTC